MENQHRKISGYRDLSQAEIDLMNRVKAAAAELLLLHGEIRQHLSIQQSAAFREALEDSHAEQERFDKAEPLRWLAMGKSDIQTGVMAMVRAIAQPGDAV
jgi:hypothetical protein